MPREYQLKTSTHTLPHNVYMQTLYIIRDYHRMVRERNNIMFSSGYNDGQPRGTTPGDSTASKAIKLACLNERINCIDEAVYIVSSHYSEKVIREDIDRFDVLNAFMDYGSFCYQLYDPNTGKQPSRSSWRWLKQTLAYEVAKKLKIF